MMVLYECGAGRGMVYRIVYTRITSTNTVSQKWEECLTLEFVQIVLEALLTSNCSLVPLPVVTCLTRFQ